MIKITAMFLLSFLIFSNSVSADTTTELFDQSILAIDEWLNSIPEKNYQQINETDVFKWKVVIENSGHDKYKKYVAYEKILAEIEDK